jgi:hypothetical protein
MRTWRTDEAKGCLEAIVALAASEGPQRLVADGEEAVVLSAAEYRRLERGASGGSEGELTEAPRSARDIYFDPAFRVLSEEEHARIFARSKEPAEPAIEFGG